MQFPDNLLIAAHMLNWSEIAKAISSATSESFTVAEYQALSGGCINRAYQIADGTQRFFIKLNDANTVEMFTAEAEALLALRATTTVRVPTPVCWGVEPMVLARCQP